MGTAVTDLPVEASEAAGGGIEIRTLEEVPVLARLTNWALEHQVPLLGLTVERLTLEDVYLRLVGDDHGDAARGAR